MVPFLADPTSAHADFSRAAAVAASVSTRNSSSYSSSSNSSGGSGGGSGRLGMVGDDLVAVRDETLVLEAVVKYGGRVESDREGNLVYVFDELQKTAGELGTTASSSSSSSSSSSRARSGAGAGGSGSMGPMASASAALQTLPSEQPIVFSLAQATQKFLVALLGGANIYGVGW